MGKKMYSLVIDKEGMLEPDDSRFCCACWNSLKSYVDKERWIKHPVSSRASSARRSIASRRSDVSPPGSEGEYYVDVVDLVVDEN